MATARQSWQFNDTGILRKKEEDEELLVFGYSCKLFRDDEKALFIDQGKHLIPWMGDETLKIDRYDGRGALYDLKQYEPLPGGHDENRWVGLSESERRFEQLCDEERYRALHHNEEEEALYQEEELKRLHKALGANDYGQVAFTYEEPSGKGDDKGEGEPNEEEEGGDEPFVAPPELDIPVNMVLPETVKLNAIIVKTAMFISQQGAQMEILLKMKQANNPQFQFLAFDSPLHPYYRHLLMAIKTGRYRPSCANKTKEETHEEGGDDHYLHPSLAPTGSRLELAPSIPSINYKPSADCAYSMLVNRIKDKQVAFGLRPPEPQEQPVPATLYYPEQPVPMAVPEPSPIIAAPPVRYEHKPVEEPQPVPEIVKAPVIHTKTKTKGKAARAAKAMAAAMPVMPIITVPPSPIVQPIVAEPVQEEPAPKTETLYSDSSRSSSRSSSPVVPPSTLVVPPSDMQIIIDKMASYVAKNGQDFEAIVKSKGDARFAFLDDGHPFQPYYRHKIAVYKKLEAKEKKVVEEKSEAAESCQETCGEESQDAVRQSPDSQRSDDGEDSKDENSRSKSKPAPVCFSIKKPKEAECLLLEKRSALPVEESSDEEEGQEGAEGKDGTKSEEKVPEVQVQEPVSKDNQTEIIDLTEEMSHSAEEEKKARWAEERLKDKLAAAAREKLAAAARERQLQLERKRRAAAFLNMIQKDHPMQVPAPPIIGPQLPDGGPVLRVSADDDDEVSSIPSPNSSDVPSPPHIGSMRVLTCCVVCCSQDVNERLSPKQQNGESKHSSSLYARIQASSQGVKRRADHRSSSSESSSCSKSKSGNKHRHKHKRKKSSSHRRGRSLSPGSHRSHRVKPDHGHSRSKKMKKKHDSRSRSRSHSTLPASVRSSHSRPPHDSHRDRLKKKKKSSKHKSGHSSDSP
ncbi:splicing factor, suppressor of white-apricot homolog [Anabrus simplex]|uniref:splicing factor, suppressor of white-apricot homolog n=1 Tax=Anabrus simplex TaxID=316456 RepID=UPI0034DCD19A